MRAARWSVASVTLPSFGSSRRPIWLREVFMRWAKLLRDMFFSFIACAICHAHGAKLGDVLMKNLRMKKGRLV